MVPKSLSDAPEPADTRLSTLIDRARFARDPGAYSDQRERARADRVFADIAAAIERGERILDPKSPDAFVLKRLRSALRSP